MTNTQTNNFANSYNNKVVAQNKQEQINADYKMKILSFSDLGNETTKIMAEKNKSFDNYYWWGTSEKAINVAKEFLSEDKIFSTNDTGSGMNSDAGYNNMRDMVEDMAEKLNLKPGSDNTTRFLVINAGMGGGSANGGVQKLIEYLTEVRTEWVKECNVKYQGFEKTKMLEKCTLPICIFTMPYKQEPFSSSKIETAKNTLRELTNECNYMLIDIETVAQWEESAGTPSPYKETTLGPILGHQFILINETIERQINSKSDHKDLDFADLRTIYSKFGLFTITNGEGMTLSSAFSNAKENQSYLSTAIDIKDAEGGALVIENKEDELTALENRIYANQVNILNNTVSKSSQGKAVIIKNQIMRLPYRVSITLTGIPSNIFNSEDVNIDYVHSIKNTVLNNNNKDLTYPLTVEQRNSKGGLQSSINHIQKKIELGTATPYDYEKLDIKKIELEKLNR